MILENSLFGKCTVEVRKFYEDSILLCTAEQHPPMLLKHLSSKQESFLRDSEELLYQSFFHIKTGMPIDANLATPFVPTVFSSETGEKYVFLCADTVLQNDTTADLFVNELLSCTQKNLVDSKTWRSAFMSYIFVKL